MYTIILCTLYYISHRVCTQSYVYSQSVDQHHTESSFHPAWPSYKIVPKGNTWFRFTSSTELHVHVCWELTSISWSLALGRWFENISSCSKDGYRPACYRVQDGRAHYDLASICQQNEIHCEYSTFTCSTGISSSSCKAAKSSSWNLCGVHDSTGTWMLMETRTEPRPTYIKAWLHYKRLYKQ